jgi:predicted transcriptional regulator
MATDISDRVREIAETRDLPESAVFEQALERGVESLWEDLVLSRYVDGEIDRGSAVEVVGESTVRRAERELDAVRSDVEWGLDA